MAIKTSGRPKPSKPMTAADAARIQSAEARGSGGRVAKGGFAARAARTVAKGRKP